MKKNGTGSAGLFKTNTNMKNQWIADRLFIGHPASVTKAVHAVNGGTDRKIRDLKKIVDVQKILESKD